MLRNEGNLHIRRHKLHQNHSSKLKKERKGKRKVDISEMVSVKANRLQ